MPWKKDHSTPVVSTAQLASERLKQMEKHNYFGIAQIVIKLLNILS